MKPSDFGLLLILLIPTGCLGVVLESAAVAEAVEVIGVIRLGVSLVEYIYKGELA